MDIRWKKRIIKKYVISIVMIVAVILMNLLPIAYGCESRLLKYADYQKNEEFNMMAKAAYNKLSWMSEYNQVIMEKDSNLLYKVYGRDMNYCNSEEIYIDESTGMIQAPAGYNFFVYYNGQEIKVYKDGLEYTGVDTSTWNKRDCTIMMAYAKRPADISDSQSWSLYHIYYQNYHMGMFRLISLILLAVGVDTLYVLRKRIAPRAAVAWTWCVKTCRRIRRAAVALYQKTSYRYRMEAQMKRAMEEQMQAERMKLELITNVSHDLKTPLTSIINYVQLLKTEEMSEDARTYVQIIDQKSEHLKNMVLDVFAISKAAAGQLEVNMQHLDYGKLIRQTVADMQQEIEKSDMELKMNIQYEPVEIITDGERMYRVFQNLIDNALKYSLPYSRIYIDLTCEDGQAVASIKNVSRQELNSKVDYTDRFVRGDKNRSDGGSGLGLAIAKSFTEYCGGVFCISADADLFTANVIFQAVQKLEEEEAEEIPEMPEELRVMIEESRKMKNPC